MLVKEDVERIVENVLRDLTIEIDRGGPDNPNSRCILLKLKGRELDRAYFSVEQVDKK
jgi:hypothetical protein